MVHEVVVLRDLPNRAVDAVVWGLAANWVMGYLGIEAAGGEALHFARYHPVARTWMDRLPGTCWDQGRVVVEVDDED